MIQKIVHIKCFLKPEIFNNILIKTVVTFENFTFRLKFWVTFKEFDYIDLELY